LLATSQELIYASEPEVKAIRGFGIKHSGMEVADVNRQLIREAGVPRDVNSAADGTISRRLRANRSGTHGVCGAMYRQMSAHD